MAISTPISGCPNTLDRGGYTVQPVPAPPPTKAEPISKKKAGTSSQKEILFKRGKAISGAPIMIGTNQLPNPPIRPGMTTKNTIIKPWAVIKTFHIWPSGFPAASVRNCTPGSCSSRRIIIENAPPIKPAMIEKII